MLAHVFNEKKHQAAGAFISEKLEGMRAFWDGGVTRGIPKANVPWANTDKDERYITAPLATGLWSRLGNVIHAPDWWLDALPAIPLDGELFTGRGEWQYMMSVVKDLEPGTGWEDVRYHCFDMPPPDTIFADGNVEYRHKQERYFAGCLNWEPLRNFTYLYRPKPDLPFQSTYYLLQKHLDSNIAIPHKQTRLPYGPQGLETAYALTERFTQLGGEGCIIRQPESIWLPHRKHTIVKLKKYKDAEATVVGYTTGRETDRGSKLLGKMGAIIVMFNGQKLELSGFTDLERELGWTAGIVNKKAPCDPEAWAIMNPCVEVPDWIQAKQFPRGTEITFTYRTLSDDGIPLEAHYHRKDQRL
jgi:hypothetical protein